MSESFARVLGDAERAVAAFGRAALAQIVRTEGSTPGKPGWKLLQLTDGTRHGNLGGGAFEALVAADAAALLGEDSPGVDTPEPLLKRYYFTEAAVRGEPTGMVCGGLAEVLLEVLEAPPILLVCGGGPVGQAVARAGAVAGFEPLVADDRDHFLRPELFPLGTRLARVSRAHDEDFLSPVGERLLYAAVVTRCWETDTAALAAILRQAPRRLRYLGLMGSRRKVARVRAELAGRGFGAALDELHAPIGLPIGGSSPGEIAISIVAELVAVRHRAALGSAVAHA
ncbi:MAG: XdhC family protein [Acidobacteriota bacterium]